MRAVAVIMNWLAVIFFGLAFASDFDSCVFIGCFLLFSLAFVVVSYIDYKKEWEE